MGEYTQIIATVITVLGSASIWKYMEVRLKTKSKAQKEELENSNSTLYRNDLKHRVKNLEAALAMSHKEKEELSNQLFKLVAEVNALRVEVDYLKKENERLKNK